MFTVFLIIAIWQLPLEQWLQICLTVFGVIHILFDSTIRIVHEHRDN